MHQTIQKQTYNSAGLFTLIIRLVVGYTYFSAFWRRLILADKLNPDFHGYIGIKFNHFLPNALGIKGIIEYLVTHPEALWYNMVAFTIIEGLVGLGMLLGVFTRLMSIGTTLLALGILLGSGWLGTTCLDEWQIGILGIAAGLTIFFSGSSSYSIDQYCINKKLHITSKKWFPWLASGILPIQPNTQKQLVLWSSIAVMVITMGTNQYFHGGVWGQLHNKSISPKIEISNVVYKNNSIAFDIFRTEGVDVYGSFLIGITIQNQQGNIIIKLNGEQLAEFPKAQIKNTYIAKVKPGAHSMEIPLGAKATIQLINNSLKNLPKGAYSLVLTDISGKQWETKINI